MMKSSETALALQKQAQSLASPKNTRPQHDPEARQELLRKGYSHGLTQTLLKHSERFAQRIWILDNSGSMRLGDGRSIVETTDGRIEEILVSRWDELQHTALHHAEMAAVLGMETHFRLLNYPGERIGVQEFAIGEQGGNLEQELRQAHNILQRTKPAGVTPLTDHILSIQETIRLFKPDLTTNDQVVSLVIATDGIPTNASGEETDQAKQDFIEALKLMEDLPVWIVVRLCTKDEKVVEFYNELDSQLEISLEVLINHADEAVEVSQYNKWLNYGLALHRCREIGFHHRLLDLIDERRLTVDEIKEFCVILFGKGVDHWADPASDWFDFADQIKLHMLKEKEQFNPIKERMGPWINVRALNKIYGRGSGSGIRRLNCFAGPNTKK